MKVLVTGGDNFIGSSVSKTLSKDFDVFFTYSSQEVSIKGCKPIRMNFFSDSEIITEKISYIKPDVVVNCSALTHLVKCEKNKDMAFRINVHGPHLLSKACMDSGAKIIHLSSDHIFNGEKGMYHEEDVPNPVNYFGLTKMLSEKMISKHNQDNIIIRANPYGFGFFNKKTFIESVIQKLAAGNTMSMPDDVFFTPVSTKNLGSAINELIENDSNGIYNIAGPDRISKYEFVRNIAEIHKLNHNLVKPVKLEQMAFQVKIGKDTSLKTKKAKTELKTKILGAYSGLAEIKSHAKGRI